MKVAGFSFIRNAVKYDYPIKEAILSVLPLCDEFVIAVGNSDDDTLATVESIGSSKIKIVHTVWDDTHHRDGKVLAMETDKAFGAISADVDWAFYIQGDEVLPDKYLESVAAGMERYKDDPNVEGLLFNYLHFYGSYDYVGESYSWYRKEVRIVRKRADIFSYRDAQGFRKRPNNKLNVKLLDAYIYHYGWVRPPEIMKKKTIDFQEHYHSDEWLKENLYALQNFDYSEIDALSLFNGSHPEVMKHRIQTKNWKFDRDITANRYTWKDTLKRIIERFTGWNPGEYKNYKIV